MSTFTDKIQVPAVILGIVLGPLAAKFLDAERWGSSVEGQQEAITLVGRIQCRWATELIHLGYVPDRDRCAAGDCGIPTTCEISTEQLERDGDLPAACHDDHVDLYQCMHLHHYP